MYILDSKYLEN